MKRIHVFNNVEMRFGVMEIHIFGYAKIRAR